MALMVKFLSSYTNTGQVKGVCHLKQSPTDENTFQRMRKQFFQALYENFKHRFPSTSFLFQIAVLDETNFA
jgi:hypothetical protein